ncbi:MULTISPECIES: GNAT family N-acetyltransferase [unclassified Acinetobacter]|uniref:GNAT family N-acetyltransferase n=1 Tax=unclassified Acinetobacter TaxID=196816 RepID=UPI002934FFBF|nr:MULTISPECIES: GNAT family N-acetyltransferase [unclassified Acinetobacter]WOE32674.1 GNAT family N-acetyltransferase [Acinetobacter sp. SAAs470]WOE38150.1 GNAT family N-acetyltransferase [Acinetobacter sp. SAAs474]
MLQKASESDFSTLIDIWESAVRATHHFLPEEEIIRLRPLILNEYFYQVLLYKYVQDGKILGFMGTSSDNIEMLFIDPIFRGKGIGRILTNFAVTALKIDKVDVNEQNLQAVGFYEKLGFKIIARSELDGQGKPYPILHLKI